MQKILFFLPLLALPAMAAANCDDIAKFVLKDMTIDKTELVGAGKFVQPPTPPNPLAPPPAADGKGKGGGAFKGGGKGKGGAAPNPYASLPEFCRVVTTLKPTSDSDIKMEVWFPTSGWNGNYQAVGNGGWAGVISYTALGTGVGRGYATSSTDTGHVGGSGQFALGHPEKLVDYAYRSEHEMVLKSKALIEAFYGKAPKYSYWVGCSTGGKQGLTEAQRYPNDFDGIVAGAPANYMIHLHAWSLWVAQAAHKTEESYIPATKYPVLHDAVLAACDAMDGVKDGVLDDPRKCKFDPNVLLCKGADTSMCLSAPQVAAAKQIYSPAINPKTKKEVFPPLEPGSEMNWNGLAGPNAVSIAADTFKYVIFKDANWDYKTLNFDTDIEKADKIDDHLNNATDPNLKPFFGHKGKLIMYHGWTDQLIAPENSINYYESVVKAVGASTSKDSMRLFMVPGMNHCNGGDGPNTFDSLTLLEQWVEKGKAPDTMLASHATRGTVDRTRPLCSYPQVAKYGGSGSTDEAGSFSCKAP